MTKDLQGRFNWGRTTARAWRPERSRTGALWWLGKEGHRRRLL